MEILLSNSGGQPIYEQISSQIKAQILAGQLPQGEPLPSIRNLAKDLRISVITTKRAYEELEADGFLYTVAGKGCFVAAIQRGLIREEHLKQIEEHMRRIVELAAGCDISREELEEMLRMIQEES